ncbi:MAG: SRPBCC family protein [Gemmatimonadota bacterium]|jgi:phenylpropionate dioxygenase-like ring-hydroxylating dioxygenase large terminal subunit
MTAPDIDPRDLEVQPVERASTITAAWYTDPAFHELEKKSVFARTWQYVGHTSQIPRVGDHITAMVARKPVLVVRAGDGRVHAFYFPNFTFNILPGRLQTNVILPIAPDRCRITFHYVYADLDDAERHGIVNDDVAFSDTVQIEDIEVCERVQEGLESGIYDKGRFSPEMETAVHHFPALLKRTFAREIGA